MEKKVIDLEIIDDLAESGVDAIALVDAPAIERNWMFFKKQEFVEPRSGESQSDYMGRCVPKMLDEGKPQDQAVAICISSYESMGAEFVYDVFADYPWDECMDDMGKRGYDEDSSKKLCGWIRANMEINTGNLAPYKAEGKPKKKEEMQEDPELPVGTYGYAEAKPGINVYGYQTRFFYMCPGAEAMFAHILSDMYASLGEDEIGMLRSAAVIADRVFEIEANAIEKGIATKDELKEAIVLVDDFKDVMGEIDEEVGMSHDVSYMDGHIEKIAELVPAEVDLSKALAFAKTAGFSMDDFKGQGMEMHEVDDTISLELAKGYTVYKYVGRVGNDTRDFCREMVGLNRFYTFEEIGAMGSQAVNPGFGLNGADTYSIWKYKGGPNCKHRWQKFYVTAEGQFQNKGPAPGTPGERPEDMPNSGYAFARVEDLKVGNAVSWKTADQNPRGRIREIVYGAKKVPGVDFVIQGEPNNPGYIIEIFEKKNGKWEPTGKFVGRKADSILKNVELWRQMFADEDRKELVGPVAVPDIEIPRRNDDGEIYFVRFSAAVVKRMAEKFLREQRTPDANIQHIDDMDAGSYVFESWIVENEEDKANSVYGFNVPVGTWMIKMRVQNPETWKKVKSGELTGFSLQGSFLSQQQYEEYKKEKKQYDEIYKLLKGF